MKPDSFEAAYARIQAATRTRTQTDIANLLGIKQSSISDAKKKNTIPDGWLVTLYRTFGLEPDWLLYGQDPISRSEGNIPLGVRETVGGYATPPTRTLVYAMARTDPQTNRWVREGLESIPLLEFMATASLVAHSQMPLIYGRMSSQSRPQIPVEIVELRWRKPDIEIAAGRQGCRRKQMAAACDTDRWPTKSQLPQVRGLQLQIRRRDGITRVPRSQMKLRRLEHGGIAGIRHPTAIHSGVGIRGYGRAKTQGPIRWQSQVIIQVGHKIRALSLRHVEP